MTIIEWSNERRKLRDLVPQADNPRRIDEPQAARLVKSKELFNQVEPIIIGPNNELYNGHQRLKVWGTQYGYDLEIDVRVSSRSLTHKEWQQLTTYLHRGTTGEFDFDVLASWNIEKDLVDWGFTPGELQWFDIDIEEGNIDLDALADEHGEPNERDFWPFIKVQVSPETFELWNSLVKQTGIEDISTATERILSCVDTTGLCYE